MHLKPSIHFPLANALLTSALSRSQELGARVSIAKADHAGELIAFARKGRYDLILTVRPATMSTAGHWLKSWSAAARRDGCTCRDTAAPASSRCIAYSVVLGLRTISSATVRWVLQPRHLTRGSGTLRLARRPTWGTAAPDLGSRACAGSRSRRQAGRLPCGPPWRVPPASRSAAKSPQALE
jgi:uncharacterized protein GlcG (DUF336 family)